MKVSWIWIGFLVAVAIFVCVCVGKRDTATDRFTGMCSKYGPIPDGSKELISTLRYSPARVKRGRPQDIPSIVHQTNERIEVPKGMASSMKILRELNPEYQYHYYTDQTAKEFLDQHFPGTPIPECYSLIKPGAFKADLFRYCVLYIKGGVYVDSAMVARTSFAKMFRASDQFVSCEDNGSDRGVYNAFMASVPGHPILKSCIDKIVATVKSRSDGGDPLNVTGPFVLGDSLKEYTGDRVLEPKDYGNGVRLFSHVHVDQCVNGDIVGPDGTVYFYTKYPQYMYDRPWYNTKPHYAELWRLKDLYF